MQASKVAIINALTDASATVFNHQCAAAHSRMKTARNALSAIVRGKPVPVEADSQLTVAQFKGQPGFGKQPEVLQLQSGQGDTTRTAAFRDGHLALPVQLAAALHFKVDAVRSPLLKDRGEFLHAHL